MDKIVSGSKFLKRKNYDINIMFHEGAVAVSGKTEVSEQNVFLLQESISHGFNEICQWIEKNDGIVGHLKGFILVKGQATMISTTGDKINLRNQASNEIKDEKCRISLIMIVFGISQTDLENKLIELFDCISNKRGR